MTKRPTQQRSKMLSIDIIEMSDIKTQRQINRIERQKKNLLKTVTVASEVSEHTKVKIVPKTERQKDLLYALEHYNQIIVTGPAGVGKTYVTVSYAAKMYLSGEIDKIVITRPNESTGKSLGHFPGDVNEKMMNWLGETVSILKKQLTPSVFDIAMKNGSIEMVPFETIRGRSFANAFILLTEAQNTSIDCMKSLVTRVGEGSTLVIDGDIIQTDIKGTNGLSWVREKTLDNKGIRELSGIVNFDICDVVRSGLCGEWVKVIYNQ
jgi:phosphate starvation-inducible protein PhoH and related proteins